MIGNHLSTKVTQHWTRRPRPGHIDSPVVHFEIAHQMTAGKTACGIDLDESRFIWDETHRAVTCIACKTVLKHNEAEVRRNRKLRDRML